MGDLKKSILSLRVRAFYLFLLPTLALVGSLWLSNYIVEFSYKPNYYETYKLHNKNYVCNSENQYCEEYNFFLPNTINNKIIECGEYNTDIILSTSEDKFFGLKEYDRLNLQAKSLNKDSSFEIFFKKAAKKNKNCIKNSSLFFLYKILPQPFDYLYKFKNNENYQSATSEAIFPFIDGKTSISNIVKRFPINYIFKPLIYIGCIFMILFWYSYNQIINQISSKSKINNFLIFGYLSCFFLFLHVLLLGVEIDNKIFKLTRKIVIVAFILFEVIAQYALLKQIYLLKNKISDLINEVYLNLKILLVGSVIVATFFIVAILLLYDLNKKIDYILEWNYFLILLFYYLFSFLMWKKNSIKLPSNPSTS